MSEPLPFHFTDYYETEMGKDLWRRMASFEPLISPDQLPGVKLWTNELESRFLNERGGGK